MVNEYSDDTSQNGKSGGGSGDESDGDSGERVQRWRPPPTLMCAVRALLHHFPEVHAVRCPPKNTLLLAPAFSSDDPAHLMGRAITASRGMRLGFNLAAKLDALPTGHHRVFTTAADTYV